MTRRNQFRVFNDEEFRELPITREGKLISIDYLVSYYKNIEEKNKRLVKLNNKMLELKIEAEKLKNEIENIRGKADSLRGFHREKYKNIND